MTAGEAPPDPLDDYAALNDPARRRAVERRGGYFVVEGALALDALLGSAYPIRSVLVAAGREAAVRAALAAAGPSRAGVPVLVRPEAEVAGVTGFAFHRGVLAAADRLPLPRVADVVGGPSVRRVAVLEGLNDHENLGALFRNAAAFGLDGVVLDPTTADPLYRRSVRVSLGHVLRVPWTRVAPAAPGPSTPGRVGGWPGTLADLRAGGFVVAALTPAPDAEPIDVLATDPPRRLALLLGAEGPGLTAAALAAADRRVRIPLAPGVDSLNVATAAAVAFHRLIPA